MGSRSVITPHASHRWAIIKGERCCLECYAQPWMAMSERECGDEARDKRDTEERDTLIAKLYTEGTKTREIASQLGVSIDTIQAVARARCVMRKAKQLPPITPEHVAIAQQRQAAGDRLVDVATDLGIDYKRLLRKLRDIVLAEQRRSA